MLQDRNMLAQNFFPCCRIFFSLFCFVLFSFLFIIYFPFPFFSYSYCWPSIVSWGFCDNVFLVWIGILFLHVTLRDKMTPTKLDWVSEWSEIYPSPRNRFFLLCSRVGEAKNSFEWLYLFSPYITPIFGRTLPPPSTIGILSMICMIHVCMIC